LPGVEQAFGPPHALRKYGLTSPRVASADGSGLVCYNSFRRSGVTELWIEVSLAVHMLFINLWLIRWKSLKQAKLARRKDSKIKGFPQTR
jgi:hypothetical protein